MSKKYCYSLNQEEFVGDFESYEHALEAATEAAEEEYSDQGLTSQEVWIGEVKPGLEFIKAEVLGEHIEEYCDEEVGECTGADGFGVVTITKEQKKELAELVIGYLKANAKVTRWGVGAVKAETVSWGES